MCNYIHFSLTCWNIIIAIGYYPHFNHTNQFICFCGRSLCSRIFGYTTSAVTMIDCSAWCDTFCSWTYRNVKSSIRGLYLVRHQCIRNWLDMNVEGHRAHSFTCLAGALHSEFNFIYVRLHARTTYDSMRIWARHQDMHPSSPRCQTFPMTWRIRSCPRFTEAVVQFNCQGIHITNMHETKRLYNAKRPNQHVVKTCT